MKSQTTTHHSAALPAALAIGLMTLLVILAYRPFAVAAQSDNTRGAAVQLSQTIVASQDNTLYEDKIGGLSNGAGQHFFAGTTGQGQSRRALLAFDIAHHIPVSSTIHTATLRLNMSKTIAGAHDVALHPVTAAWGEGTADADLNEGAGTAATGGDATWLHTFHATAFWATPGGDFAAVASATTSVGDVGQYQWQSPAMTADVQMWLDVPTQDYGWLLLGDETADSTAKRFDSRETPESSNQPQLIVSYELYPFPFHAYSPVALHNSATSDTD